MLEEVGNIQGHGKKLERVIVLGNPLPCSKRGDIAI
jgi:hypothetical protein